MEGIHLSAFHVQSSREPQSELPANLGPGMMTYLKKFPLLCQGNVLIVVVTPTQKSSRAKRFSFTALPDVLAKQNKTKKGFCPAGNINKSFFLYFYYLWLCETAWHGKSNNVSEWWNTQCLPQRLWHTAVFSIERSHALGPHEVQYGSKLRGWK